MQDITEVQRRLEAALSRISAGLERIGPDTGTEAGALREALEAERTLTRDLQERAGAEAEEAVARIADLERDAGEMRAEIATLEADRARLRATADTLRGTCESLRRAASRETGDAEAINTAMETEIEALAAARASDRAELEAIIALLTDGHEEGATNG